MNWLRLATRVGLAMLAVLLLGLVGCKTEESENAAERPWNAPQGFEHGFPGGMGGR
jgi:hypothetical protein